MFNKFFLKFSIFNFLMFFVSNNISFLDAPIDYQLGLQDPATPIMEGIINFHNHIMFFMVGIGCFTFWLIFRCLTLFADTKENEHTIENFTHSTELEIVWTIVPAIILMLIAVPSFTLLYSMDEMIDPSVTFKTIGHQWYWSYEYSNHFGMHIQFDSYMVPENALPLGSFRLLEVDNSAVLPANKSIRMLVTSTDVLHSWAVPSLGVKLDACPGRLNQISIQMTREGKFYGQCSEICGLNHGFMPIVVESLSPERYLQWYDSALLWLIYDNMFSVDIKEDYDLSKFMDVFKDYLLVDELAQNKEFKVNITGNLNENNEIENLQSFNTKQNLATNNCLQELGYQNENKNF
jgi:cytochrome c oxidase subunit 2